MTRPIVTVGSVSREMTDDEYAQWQIDVAAGRAPEIRAIGEAANNLAIERRAAAKLKSLARRIRALGG